MKSKEIHEGGWLKPILKHGKWYLFASFFTKGLNILLIPVFTTYLSPEDYGVLNSLYSVSQFLPVILSLSLDAAFARFFHEMKNDKQQLQKLFSTVFWFVLIYGAFNVIVVLFTAKFWMNDLLKVNAFPYAFLAFIPPLFVQLGALGGVFLKQSLQARKTTILQIISALITVAVTLPLLIPEWFGFDYGILAKLWGNLVASIFLFVFYTIYFFRINLLDFVFDKRLLKRCIVYSFPLIPAVASSWIAGLSDRLIIAKYVDLTATGLYSLGYQAGHILYVIGDAITQVIGPITMSGLISDKERVKNKIADYSLFLWAFMLLANLGMFMFSREIVMLFANELYQASYIVIPIIGFMYVLGMQHRFFSTVISFHKKTWMLTIAGFVAAILNLILNFIFIPKYGYVAAAVTSVFSVLIFTIIEFIWSQRLDKINFHYVKIFLIFVIFLASLFLVGRFYDSDTLSWINILEKFIVLSIVSIIFILIVDRKLISKVFKHLNYEEVNKMIR